MTTNVGAFDYIGNTRNWDNFDKIGKIEASGRWGEIYCTSKVSEFFSVSNPSSTRRPRLIFIVHGLIDAFPASDDPPYAKIRFQGILGGRFAPKTPIFGGE